MFVFLQEGEALVHVVLGGPEPDVDAVAATLSLALHLCQVALLCLFCATLRLPFALRVHAIYSTAISTLKVTRCGASGAHEGFRFFPLTAGLVT